ncbi:hypothetical protein ACFQT0_21200 [Hymenobacter humi]|uniref:Uncharacterized protein n=1 Tax=Hymenobacter humi TaxID=1411620 RepID=A0ABW2UB70_9BACT
MNTTFRTPNLTYARLCTPALATTSFAKRATASWLHFLLLFVAGFLFSGNALAQTVTLNCPSRDRCTSKDLEVVSAYVEGADQCTTCTGTEQQTRKLYLNIVNKTGSERTSFAVFGTLSGSVAGENGSRIFCGGPIAPNSTVPIEVGTVTYVCGTTLRLTDVFVAWTDASDGKKIVAMRLELMLVQALHLNVAL